MNAPDAATRFGSGRAVHRIEDARAARRPGPLRRQPRRRRPGDGRVPALAVRARAHRRHRHDGGARSMPGVLAVYTGADLVAAGLKPMPANAGFKRADGVDGRPGPPRARARDGALRRRAGRRRRRRIARGGARRRRSIVVDYDEIAAVTDVVAATTAGAATLVPNAPDNIAAEMRHGDAAATEAAFARAAHAHRARPRQPARRAGVDGAAQHRRHGRRRRAAACMVRISSQMPTGVRRDHRGVAAGSRADRRQRAGRRRRRRLRHEDRHLSGRHRRRARRRAR